MMNDANYSNVKFKAMKVWSAGENGKTKRREMICGYIISILSKKSKNTPASIGSGMNW